MSDIREHNFYNYYPLNLLSVTHRVTSEKNLDIKEYELYYETPVIKFYTILDSQTTRYYFEKRLNKYLKNIIKHVDEYIDTKYPNIYSLVFNYDIVVTYGIYFQGHNEGPKQVLSFQDDDHLPTYSFSGISKTSFISPFKIFAKANVYLIKKNTILRIIE